MPGWSTWAPVPARWRVPSRPVDGRRRPSTPASRCSRSCATARPQRAWHRVGRHQPRARPADRELRCRLAGEAYHWFDTQDAFAMARIVRRAEGSLLLDGGDAERSPLSTRTSTVVSRHRGSDVAIRFRDPNAPGDRVLGLRRARVRESAAFVRVRADYSVCYPRPTAHGARRLAERYAVPFRSISRSTGWAHDRLRSPTSSNADCEDSYVTTLAHAHDTRPDATLVPRHSSRSGATDGSVRSVAADDTTRAEVNPD